MAKKATKKENKIVLDQNLPQNIMLIGERGEKNKNIYISQEAYKEIHRFTKNKTTNESGGMLVGIVIEEFGKTNVVVYGFVEAKYSEGTPTTLKFTHETWDYVHGEIEKRYENAQIVGWIHTHPDFGIFLSEYDTFIQENFFKEDYQIAYVVDPIQKIEGFYFWINEKIERCKGFYIFDKTGEKIEIEEKRLDKKKDTAVEHKGMPSNQILLWLIGSGLVISIIVFAIISINMLNRMKILENQQENLVESVNQSIGYLQQQIMLLNGDIADLKDQIEELKIGEGTDDALINDEESEEANGNSDGTDVVDEATDGKNETDDDTAEREIEDTENIENNTTEDDAE